MKLHTRGLLATRGESNSLMPRPRTYKLTPAQSQPRPDIWFDVDCACELGIQNSLRTVLRHEFREHGKHRGTYLMRIGVKFGPPTEQDLSGPKDLGTDTDSDNEIEDIKRTCATRHGGSRPRLAPRASPSPHLSLSQTLAENLQGQVAGRARGRSPCDAVRRRNRRPTTQTCLLLPCRHSRRTLSQTPPQTPPPPNPARPQTPTPVSAPAPAPAPETPGS